MDRNPQLASVTDGQGNKTTYSYDPFGRLYRTYFPDPSSVGQSSSTDYEEYGYNSSSQITSTRRRSGDVIQTPRDNLGRVTAVNGPGNAEDVAYSYDNQGRVLSALFNAGSGVAQTYDGLGRLDTRTVFGRQLSYQYDLAGRRTRLTYPDAFYVTYAYTNVDELQSITDSTGAVLATYGYDELGFRNSLSRLNGASTTFVPDAVKRLQQLTQDLSGSAFDLTTTFSYNPANQIATKSSNNDSAYTWTPPVPNSSVAGQFDGQNQLTNFAGTAVTDDANANVRTGLNTLTYTFDALGQVRQASGGASSVNVDYDPAGMLRRLTVGSAVTEYLYDGPDLILQYNGSGTVVRRFVHGPGLDEPLVVYDGSGTTSRSWLHADERGSIIAATNASGTTASSVKYTSDGDSGTLASAFGYTGQLYLPDLQLYYYKARMYSPKAGRFLQPDPIGHAGGMNLYGYVGNDPVNFRDPTGLCELWNSNFWNGETLTVVQHGVSDCLREWNDALANLFGLSPGGSDAGTGGGGSPQQENPTILRSLLDRICEIPAGAFGAQVQLNRGFLRMFGGEGQVGLTVTTHGQAIWTHSAGGVIGINQGLVLSSGFTGGWMTTDAPSGYSAYSTLGFELVEAEPGGMSVGVAESTDESAVAINLLDLGIAVGGGLVAGVNHQRGLALSTPPACTLLR